MGFIKRVQNFEQSEKKQPKSDNSVSLRVYEFTNEQRSLLVYHQHD